jgi:hypothetical protein
MRYLFILLLASCGYHATQDLGTISIPYVEGDEEGILTAELVRHFSHSGTYTYAQKGGDVLLQVKLVDKQNNRIGFRYDRNGKSGAIQQNLLPTENRRSAIAEVSLIDPSTGETILGPERVSASTEYDYVDVNSLRDLSFIDSSGHRQTVLNFSEGQVDSIEGGHDDAARPLYRHLAEKIASAVSQAKE